MVFMFPGIVDGFLLHAWFAFLSFFILAHIGTDKSQRLARYLHVFGIVSILLACISVVMFQGVGEGFLLHACSHFIFYFTTLLPGFADLLLFLLVLFWIRIREFKMVWRTCRAGLWDMLFCLQIVKFFSSYY